MEKPLFSCACSTDGTVHRAAVSPTILAERSIGLTKRGLGRTNHRCRQGVCILIPRAAWSRKPLAITRFQAPVTNYCFGWITGDPRKTVQPASRADDLEMK